MEEVKKQVYEQIIMSGLSKIFLYISTIGAQFSFYMKRRFMKPIKVLKLSEDDLGHLQKRVDS